MSRWYITYIVSLTTYCLLLDGVNCEEACDTSSGRELSGSIESRKNGTYEWLTTFGAERTTVGNQSDIQMVINHKYFECEGKTTVKIQGVIREFPFPEIIKARGSISVINVDHLRFHQRCGTNAKITNNGKSLEKIDNDKMGNSVAFTNRPLKDDELFEVVIDERGPVGVSAIGIGVTTYSPDSFDIPYHMNNVRSGTWMMYLSNVYKDGSTIKINYMKDFKDIKVGDRIGVKRTSAGDLHLFINGVDQGVAASSIPSAVYGVFELQKVYKVSMIDR